MDAMIQGHRFQLAALIERVLSGELAASAALAEAEGIEPVVPSDRAFEAAWHALVHYEIDADIRATDEAYAEAQREGLRTWLVRLRGSEQPPCV